MSEGFITEFGSDAGTLWPIDGSGVPLSSLAESPRRDVRARARPFPIVWLVDDERKSREWFVKEHRLHFAVVTFSSRDFVAAAIQKGFACDIVVTDVFFPAKLPTTEAEEAALLSIYQTIEDTPIGKLSEMLPRTRDDWVFEGFWIAKDIAAWARRLKQRIPVVLYSRKAPLLLLDSEWLNDPDAVRNTYWVTEKIDPEKTGQHSRTMADIQRHRIESLLEIQRKIAPLWMRILAGVGFRIGPFQYSLGPLAPKP
jgi:hypothetical protein